MATTIKPIGYSNGNGNGYGDGYGDGNGNGYGDGDGYGYGHGYGTASPNRRSVGHAANSGTAIHSGGVPCIALGSNPSLPL